MGGHKPIIEFTIKVVIEPDDDGFHAYCPALKGLHTCGHTKEEALRNAGDAAIAYLQSLIKHGDPIPVGVTFQERRRWMPHFPTKRASSHTQDLRVACAI